PKLCDVVIKVFEALLLDGTVEEKKGIERELFEFSFCRHLTRVLHGRQGLHVDSHKFPGRGLENIRKLERDLVRSCRIMTFQDEQTVAVDCRWNIENGFGLRDVRDVVPFIDEDLKRCGKFIEGELLAKLGG